MSELAARRISEIQDYVAQKLDRVGLRGRALLMRRYVVVEVDCPHWVRESPEIKLGNFVFRKNLQPVLARIGRAIDAMSLEEIKDAIQAHNERQTKDKLTPEQIEALYV